MFRNINSFLLKGNYIIPFLWFLRIFLIVGVIGFSYFLYQQQSNLEITQYKFLEEERTAFLKSNIEDVSDKVVGDLLILTNQHEFSEYIESKAEGNDATAEENLQNITDEIEVLASLRKAYDQVRFIDVDGQEVIRVNYRAGLTYVTPPEELQNKSDRYYFKEAISLPLGEIYVSPLDLNVENGQIEEPIKPMIRVASPVYYEGEVQGIFIINYLAQEIFDILENKYGLLGERIYLINEDGYWLKGPSAEDEWGFMYGDTSKTVFSWDIRIDKTVFNNDRYQGLSESGLISIVTVSPFDYSGRIRKKINIFSDDEFMGMKKEYIEEWRIISYIPTEYIQQETRRILNYLVVTNVAIISLLLIATTILIAVLKERFRTEKVVLKLNETLRIITKILRHDLANAFTHINFAIELYKDNRKDDGPLEEINKSAHLGISIIEQMKQLEGMVEQGGLLKRMNVREVLNSLISQHQLEINISGDADVKADDGLASVFNNLIDNAVRHGETKKIDIKITNQDKKVTIKFIDYGKGIPDKIKEDVFKDGFTYGKHSNTGLGLYIVDQTVQRYGGKIWVEDNKPKGAVFVMEFPEISFI